MTKRSGHTDGAAAATGGGLGGRLGPYDDPRLYDVLHTPGTAREVDGLELIAARFVRRPARGLGVWLEPACGSGRYLRVAAGRGRRVIGFDQSPAMVAYAVERARRLGLARRSRYFVGDMTDFGPRVKAGSVDFAFNPINTLRHLESDGAALAHLRCIKRALKPGGVYAVGLSLCAYGVEVPSEDVWRGSRGGLRVTQTVQYLPSAANSGRRGNHGGRFERVISHLEVRSGSRVWHVDSAYRLRGYNERQWRDLVARAGLRVLGVVDERGRDLPLAEPGYGVFVLGGGDTG
jgi:SAM-dependent methyltransferase